MHFLPGTIWRLTGWGLTLIMVSGLALQAATITGYDADTHNRFASGFPTAPVANTHDSFIGAALDWSGVAWSTTTYANSSYKGLGMLSPMHFVTASHYESGASRTQGLRVLGRDGVVYAQSVQGVVNLGHGLLFNNVYDLSLGRLHGPVAPVAQIARYAVLDLHDSSTSITLSPYSGLDLLLHGRSNTTYGSPRVGPAAVDMIACLNGDLKQTAIRTSWETVQLQSGDSGHPALYSWTNPNGGRELTVLGVNSAIDTTNGYNWISFMATPGAISAVNAAMTGDGYALRVVGNPVQSWAGDSRNDIHRDVAWGASGSPNASTLTADQYVLFDGAATASRAVAVTVDHELRGIYFRSTAGADNAFTFSGDAVLTIGRGGITNYDQSRQMLGARLRLGDHQYWDVGPGGLTTGDIDTNGNLLEIAGSGTAHIAGAISGTGSIALSGDRLELAGQNTYTGTTYVHSGVLHVSGSIASSQTIELGLNARLEGSGRLGVLAGSGAIEPGMSPGIMTAQRVDPSGGLSFHFEFTGTGSPIYTDATASINDVLRLTGDTPFMSPLSADNSVHLYMDVLDLADGDVFRGGFYVDQAGDFLATIDQASVAIFLASEQGAIDYNGVLYDLYSGPSAIELSTVAEMADFGDGIVYGQVMQVTVSLQAIPEPASLAVLMLLVLGLLSRQAARRDKGAWG